MFILQITTPPVNPETPGAKKSNGPKSSIDLIEESVTGEKGKEKSKKPFNPDKTFTSLETIIHGDNFQSSTNGYGSGGLVEMPEDGVGSRSMYRKGLTYGLNGYMAYRLLRPGVALQPFQNLATAASGAPKGAFLTKWFATGTPKAAAAARLSEKLGKIGGFLRLGGAGSGALRCLSFLGKAMPYIGGALAVLDVWLDYNRVSSMDKPGDVVVNALKNLPENISASDQVTARNLASVDLNKGENVKALEKHLEGITKPGSEDKALTKTQVKQIIEVAMAQQQQVSAATCDARTNATCTFGGAAIGALIGGLAGVGIFSVPGAILGGFIGAGIGNLVGMFAKPAARAVFIGSPTPPGQEQESFFESFA